ncbi:SMP-30/Gluconolaconase/LRE-like region-containing protein [Nocardioides terrae]|uniref:SMP-30/Gluconolaconase/LRE-like region-containing protein n=1 Tax=Nocardioides terrae TaxID=574651 RepID=A0A1I1FQU3_9ACTN|nr:SMP-30/gluconolactonase/LRE family protein [Nocardioides terrae]SFB99978.1 SMP-30/Gluconolaconase/LRE-like region-containing protein [Nocardioides terrae]
MVSSFEVIPVPAGGAEDVVVGTGGRDEGAVFTGTVDGSIWRISHDARRVDLVGRTGGRPLGLELDGDGRLLICDARRGVLRMDTASGAVEQLTAEAGGRALVFCNNAAIAADGTVWFSDSSAHHGIDSWKDEMVQATRTGRLVRLAPDGETSVEVEGLSFANGVALSSDEAFVAVAETAGRTVVRHWLDGRPDDLLVGDLPGYPDNIARGSDGLIWVSLASPVDPLVERLQQAPGWVQRSITRVPDKVQPKPRRTVRVQAYDDRGALVHDIDIDTQRFHMVTGVRERDGVVWLGSLHEPAVASFRLTDG